MVCSEGILAFSLDPGQNLPLVEEVISSLRKCRENKDLELTNRVYNIIHSHGLESYSVLGNHLVPVYIECGSISNAKQVFLKLSERNEHAWTSLIQGHVEREEFRHALCMFNEMQRDTIQPSKFTLHSVLKACSSLGDLNQARETHSQIMKTGLDADSFVGVSLVDMYAKCGSLLDAQAVSLMMSARNGATWNALIMAYSDQGLVDDVLHCLKEMQCDGVAPDAMMLVHALRACIETGSLSKGQEVHAEIAHGEFEGNLLIGNMLIDMYVKSSLLVDAHAVLNELPNRDVVSWTTMIAGYVEQGLVTKVFDCWEQMLVDGVPPNNVTFVCMLKSCSCMGAVTRGQKLHAEIAMEGLENCFSVGTSLVDMYGKCGLLAEARQVFEDCPDRDVVSWNVLIAAYAENAHIEEAFEFFAEMQRLGVVANSATFSVLLKGCCSTGRLDKGRTLHKDLIIEGFETESFVGCTLVDMFAKCGFLTEAEDIFNDLSDRNVVAWTALIIGYTEHDLGGEALRCFKQMGIEGVLPNVATYICTLKSCSMLESAEKGHEIHMDIIKLGLENHFQIGCSLIDMYAKHASLAEARNVFNNLLNRDAASWNALLTAYTEQGDTDDAFNLVEGMHKEGVSPDAGTYLCSLKVCIIRGDVVKGKLLHSEILKHGFEASSFIGNTILDMYTKCGAFAEAQVVFEHLSKCDVVSWNTLMVGYYEHSLFMEVLNCLEQMRQNTVYADILTFVYSLKACSCAGCREKGQELHHELIQMGLEDDPSLSINLVDMYANCGYLVDAQHAFGSMSSQCVTSWNVLIGGFVEHSHGEEALKLLEEMHSEGIHPNNVTFIIALKACCIVADIDRGKDVHSNIMKGGFEDDILIGKALVDMYWKCGSLLEAQKVFDHYVSPDAALWNAMFAGYVQHGHAERVFTFLEHMEVGGISPDISSFDYSLKACSDLRALELGQELHSVISKKGCESDPSIGNNLLHMYVHCGCLSEADAMLDQLLLQGTVSWEGLIAVYAKHGLDEKVLKGLEMALFEGGHISSFVFVCGFKACCNLRAILEGQKLHAEVIKETLEVDIWVSNILVHMYAKCGMFFEAKEVFNDIEVQDVVSWTSLMAGYIENGLNREALSCLEQMQPLGVSPNAFTFACCLRACNRLGDLSMGRKIHYNIITDGFESDQYVCSTLVDMYVKCGSMVEAQDVFEDLASGNVVFWNTMITGFSEQDLSEGALDCLEQMLLEGLSPNAVTYVCSLKACGSIGAINKGRELHLKIAIEGLEHDTYIGSTLIDMYAKCGALLEAGEVFDELLVKNTESWTALIAGYTSQGHNELALCLFERMIQTGVQPDGVSLLSVLSVCNHTGLVEKGLTYFDAFSSFKGIRLTLEHYNCLIDTLSRAGQLKECLYVIETMPFEPNYVTWRTMLGACRKWSDGKLGKHAFECALRMDKMQIAACVLMYNIYVDADMWEDAMRVDALKANIQAQKLLRARCNTDYEG